MKIPLAAIMFSASLAWVILILRVNRKLAAIQPTKNRRGGRMARLLVASKQIT